jgi:hypothetical protein
MLIEVLQYLVPGAEMVVVGEPQNKTEYAAQVTWLDERPQPSWAQVQASIPEFEVAKANEIALQGRQSAYRSEADPLFFQWQRGEGTEQAWLDKVAEIRERYPYIEA